MREERPNIVSTKITI